MSDIVFEVWFVSVYGKNRDPWFKDDMKVAWNAGIKFMQNELDTAEEHIASMTKKLEKIEGESK